MKLKYLTILLLALVMQSCSQKPAKIINRNQNVYDKNNQQNKIKYLDKNNKNTNRQNDEGDKKIVVESGETLYSVAKKHSVVLRDLIEANKLTPPFVLKAGSTLIIPKPIYHEVKNSDTLYSISREHQINIDQLYQLNNLNRDSNIKVGQKIRLAKFIENTINQSNNDNLIENNNKNTQVNNLKNRNYPANNAVELANKTSAKPNPKINESNEDGNRIIENSLDKVNHFIWPLKGEVVSQFGPKQGGLYNDGINIKANQGSIIKTSDAGIVAYVGNELKSYGNLIIIKHKNGWISAYAHLSKISVQNGQKIQPETAIGEVGKSGNVKFPQLYFSLRKGRDAVNPENYLNYK